MSRLAAALLCLAGIVHVVLGASAIIEADDKVVAVARAVGAGSASQVAVDEPFAFVFTFKGERIAREQAFRNREEALEAAGLSE